MTRIDGGIGYTLWDERLGDKVHRFTKVTIPSSVKVIDDGAFDEMPTLKEVVLNEGLEEIGVDVFLHGNIASIKLPSTVVSMRAAAFGQNPLTKIEVAEGNPRYAVTDNGLLVDAWEKKLQLSIRNQGKLVIPDGVEVIGCNSLELVKLSSVSFPQSLRELEDDAFGTGTGNAGNFSSAELDFSGTQLEKVGGLAFGANTQLKTVRFPATVRSLGYWTFAHCSALTSVYFSGGVPELTDPLIHEWIAEDLPDLLKYPDGDIYVETVGNPPPRLRNVTTYVTPDHGWEDICQVGTWQGRTIKMKTSVTVTAVGSGTASLPVVTVTGLPSGLAFDAKALAISGKPTKPGKYAVKVSLRNTTVTTAKTMEFEIFVPNIRSALILDGIDYDSDAYSYVAGTSVEPILPELAPGCTLTASGLSAGLKLAKEGDGYAIAGVPTAKAGSYTVTLNVTQGKVRDLATITGRTGPSRRTATTPRARSPVTARSM